MLQKHVQFFFHDNQSEFIATVDYKDNPVAILVIMLPQRPVAIMAGHIERSEIDIFN